MTHCPEWEDLFKKRPEACVESADYRRKVEKWLSTLESIRARNVQVTTKQFPEGAHRKLSPLDDQMRETALNYICHKLERGEKITSSDLEKSIAVWEGKAAAISCPIPKNNTNVLPETAHKEVKIQTLAEQQAAKQINPGSLVTVSPIVIDDSYRQAPTEGDPAKVKRQEFAASCQQVYDKGPRAFKQAIDDLMAYHSSWKSPADVIYFCVTGPQEAVIKRRK